MVFLHARSCRRLNPLLSVQKQMYMLSGRSSFASQSMMLKRMENNGEGGGGRRHPCLMPLEMGKLSDSDLLCFT